MQESILLSALSHSISLSPTGYKFNPEILFDLLVLSSESTLSLWITNVQSTLLEGTGLIDYIALPFIEALTKLIEDTGLHL